MNKWWRDFLMVVGVLVVGSVGIVWWGVSLAADRTVIQKGCCQRTVTERVDYSLVEGGCTRKVTGIVQWTERKEYEDFKLVSVAVDTQAVAADTSSCQ